MDIQKILDEATGLCVEVGGPTPEGYEFQKRYTLPHKSIVTNLSNPIVINPFGDNPQTFGVDQVADIRDFPYADGSIGILLVNSLPRTDPDGNDLREIFWRTAYRVLSPSGIAVFEEGEENDVVQAETAGLRVIKDAVLPYTIFAVRP